MKPCWRNRSADVRLPASQRVSPGHRDPRRTAQRFRKTRGCRWRWLSNRLRSRTYFWLPLPWVIPTFETHRNFRPLDSWLAWLVAFTVEFPTPGGDHWQPKAAIGIRLPFLGGKRSPKPGGCAASLSFGMCHKHQVGHAHTVETCRNTQWQDKDHSSSHATPSPNRALFVPLAAPNISKPWFWWHVFLQPCRRWDFCCHRTWIV